MKYNVLVLKLQLIKIKFKKKKEKKEIFLRFGRISMISYNPMIKYDPILSYMRSYNIYDPCAILNILVRWGRKIMRFYDPDLNSDNHGWMYL